ncbi:MAG TPA: HAMP domain-containing sensor histidine kinase [Rhodopila sp.]|jgi:signal transduction histidine kinase
MSQTGSSEPRSRPGFGVAAWRFARWLVPAIYAISALAFIEDIRRDNTLAYGIIYAPLVATAVFHKGRTGLWIIGVAACLMVVVGTFLPVFSPDMPDMIGNRVLSLLAITATAIFVRHARNIQDRLSAETRRAEAAERIKTDVLTNLSQEIRTPLHTLLGVLSLTMATSQPEQREALGRVRRDGKQLLATIDNLLDLTQIEERQLKRQTVDIATIARDAAESVRATASERQISIALSPDRQSGDAAAIGDSWAMRRILDNLLANAVRLTPPGGTVSVSVARRAGTVTASVSDTGRGMSPRLTHELRADAVDGSDASLPESGGTGLALSNRLARAMNGRLTAYNQPDSGATVCLSLPAA